MTGDSLSGLSFYASEGVSYTSMTFYIGLSNDSVIGYPVDYCSSDKSYSISSTNDSEISGVIYGKTDIQSIWKSSVFWQLTTKLQKEIDWEYDFQKRIELREALKEVYKLRFWILLERKHWFPYLLEFVPKTSTDNDADSRYMFQNLRVPPPSIETSTHAQYLADLISSVFGRETDGTPKNTLLNEGGGKYCKDNSEKSSKKFSPVYPELRLNLQNHLKNPFENLLIFSRMILNSLKKASLYLFKYYKALKKVILSIHSKTWCYYSSSSSANKTKTRTLSRLFSPHGRVLR